MKRSVVISCLALACCLAAGLCGGPATAQKATPGTDGKKLAVQARAILKEYCYRCHGVEFAAEGLDVLNFKALIARRDEEEPYVVPGQPGKSSLFKRFGTSMPPRKVRERPSEAQKAIIKQWIEAGAPDAPKVEARPFVSTTAVLTAIRDHLLAADKNDRENLRYFTFTNLYNDPRTTEADLRTYRAALSKALNSLSWKKVIVVPEAIDKQKTVVAIDIRDLDWDREHLWRALMRAYPYALNHDGVADRGLRRAYEDVIDLTKCEIPLLRADWFVATATRPPLYHTLLRIPTHATELERKLDVDFMDNFRRKRLARAGFATSGVSGQNRLVERHRAAHGAYWKSYDFKADRERGNLIRYPLGPVFKGNPYARQAFEHDGGEFLFNLPNGLQGYMLVNGKDERIDSGPEDVVSDSLKTSGTNAIVNGLSCMACHKQGVIPFKDEVRRGNAVAGMAREKVLDLYPEHEPVMKKLLQTDENLFVEALEKAVGPFLQVGEDKDRPIRTFLAGAEMVGDLARRYRLVDLKLADVACELGYARPEDLEARLKNNRPLREMGMAVLLTGGAVKRHDWERVGATSLFQRVARELELGTPVTVIR